MKKSDHIKRMISFYACVTVFFVTLPIVLSYSLGYHIDYFPKFTIYKTGILHIRTQPAGASVFVNSHLHREPTPTNIEELKPGAYRIEVQKEGYYPWHKDLVVRPNMVTKADAIVLFPVAQEMRRIGNLSVSDFVVSEKNVIYYMTPKGLFRSNVDGTGMRKLSSFAQWPTGLVNKKLSPDGDKLLFFDDRHIWVVSLAVQNNLAQTLESARVEEVFASENPFIDVFWYSDSSHIVLATESEIIVLELVGEGRRNAVTLYTFNARPKDLRYDANTDSLYFTDLRKEEEGEGTYLYRLDLKQKFFDTFLKRIKKELNTIYE